MKKVMVVLFVVFASISRLAWADCEYQGKYYPTGTRIGSKVCQADGTWK